MAALLPTDDRGVSLEKKEFNPAKCSATDSVHMYMTLDNL